MLPVAAVLSLILFTQATNLLEQSSLQLDRQSPELPYLFWQPDRHWRSASWQLAYCFFVAWLTGFAQMAHRVPAEMSETTSQTRIGFVIVFKPGL